MQIETSALPGAPAAAGDLVVVAAVYLAGYVALLATSTSVVSYFLERWTGTDLSAGVDADQRDTGRVIGKCENVLVLTLVFVGAYTALGLVFAAKSLVRREDMTSGDTTWYLAGTLVNFTYSIVVGVVTSVAAATLPTIV
ncbi:hypothetical protein [Halobaculum roseum]|uniref:DUF350 domain-containing protein n=1 Tax=Halobaculum roseum TaxID=2175149 RepID=A0ABD5MR35_9EURY|nr:hypothetical protein [Halobaculum roseum]QZY01343.1 hypothetical protein K6T36_08240 [Halobaculum roseum]